MIVDFSKANSEDNILKLKPETKFEASVLLNMGREGKWKIYVDADVAMVVANKDTKLRD